MSISTAPPPKFISRIVAAAPALLAIAALVSSFAAWKPSSTNSQKVLDEVAQIHGQIVQLSTQQNDITKSIASLQIQQNDELTRRKVIAELEYSSALIEARTLERRFGKEVADQYLLNKQKIRDEIIKASSVDKK